MEVRRESRGDHGVGKDPGVDEGTAGVRTRYGIMLPFDVPLSGHRPYLELLARHGWTDAWAGEADGADAFTPLALAAAWAPDLRLGTAITPAFTRGPALLAQSIAAMAEAAPGRFAAGIGASSPVIVENWNAQAFDRPWHRVRDTLRFLRRALAGERIDERYDTFAVSGFRLARPPEFAPLLLTAALRPDMLRLAGAESDGAILNFLSADDVPRVVAEVGPAKEIVARLTVCPSDETDTVRAAGKRLLAGYLNVPVYAAFHDWMGRGEQLRSMREAWAAGDRRGAVAAVPDELVDELILHGSPDSIAAAVERYVANGVTTPILSFLPGVPLEIGEAIRLLGPGSTGASF
jgi:probable F420-dependent oxidoreductase